MPDTEQERQAKAKKAAITAAIAGAVLVAAPLAVQFEGYSGKVYRDPAHIPTQCYGETVDINPLVVYSKTECAAKLRTRMARDYGPKIASCIPGFIDQRRRMAFGAVIDASYNAGPAGVCHSRAAVLFNRGDWRGGCNALRGWYTTARNRKTGVRIQLPGLVRRRNAEAAVCLKGAV
jgi:lysozyme